MGCLRVVDICDQLCKVYPRVYIGCKVFSSIEQLKSDQLRIYKEKHMCRPVTCRVCNKTTWAGCGEHVADVKKQVPASQWCDGKHSDAEKAQAGSGGFFARLFGR